MAQPSFAHHAHPEAQPTRRIGEHEAAALPRVRFPIRTKITLPYLILALVLAAATAYVMTFVVLDTIEERFTNQLIENGKLASEWMVMEEGRRLETLRLLAYTNGVAEAVTAGDAERLRELTFGVVANTGEEEVAFLNRRGDLLLAVRRDETAPEGYTFARGGGAAYADFPFVQQVLAGHVDQRGDKFAGVSSTGWGDFFYISGPVSAADGSLAGAVLVGRSLTGLARQMREDTLAQVTFYDFQGQAQATTFFEPRSLPPEPAGVLETGQGQSSLRRSLNVANIGYQEILGVWQARGDTPLGYLGVSLPETFLVSASYPTRIRIFVLATLALLLVAVLGLELADRITRPITELVTASGEVAEGNLQVQVRPSSNDEIAVLSESFNRMVSRLYFSQLELVTAYDVALEGWARALELRDSETEGHTQRVTDLTVQLAYEVGIQGEEDLIHIRRGALLHDIGKMGIPDSVLLKPGPLTEEEWRIMRRHPEYAYDLISPDPYLRPAVDIPYCHHEKWDGSGYPRGLAGEAIPLAARVFAMIDVWDALSSDRRYRPAWPAERIYDYFNQQRGRHFDPRMVDAFFKLLRAAPL